MTDSTPQPGGEQTSEPEFAALAAFDWADQKHAGALSAAAGPVECFELEQSAQPIDDWACQIRQRFGGKPVAVCLEQSKGALIYALMKYDFLVLFPVNPKQLARFREAFAPNGGKNDPSDACLLLEMLQRHRRHLRCWLPDDPATRQIRQLVADRRMWVNHRTRLTNKLKSRLKQYFPLALEVLGELDCELACQFLLRWGSLEELQREPAENVAAFYRTMRCQHPDLVQRRLEKIAAAVPLVTDQAIISCGRMLVQGLARQLLELIQLIKQYDGQLDTLTRQHADGEIFLSFPGAGKAMAPRLLAAFGDNRQRIQSAAEMQCLSGIAPVVRQSGKSRQVQRRWGCNKFLRQTFHEYAQHSMRYSAWAKAYYDMQRACGKQHQAAVRALAFKWIRILTRCWRTRTRYDELRYFAELQKRGSPVLQYITRDHKAANPLPQPA